MINKAYFFREVNNLEELREKTSKALQNKERIPKYYIKTNVNLLDDEFEKFVSNFRKTYDFITPYRAYLNMNKEYVCIAVSSPHSNFKILVNT